MAVKLTLSLILVSGVLICPASQEVLSTSPRPAEEPSPTEEPSPSSAATEEPVRYESRMYSGNLVSWVDYKYFAQIVIQLDDDNGERQFVMHCGGAFITLDMVLTASSCFDQWNGDLSTVRIRYGLDTAHIPPNTRGKEELVNAIYIHSGIRHPPMVVDVALVRLAKPIEDVKGAVLLLPEPWEDDEFVDGAKNASIVSSGKSFGSDPGWSLKEDQIRLYHENCHSQFDKFDVLYQMCGRSEKSRLCWDDYGSPIVATTKRGDVHIGLFSRKTYYCHKSLFRFDEKMVFARTSAVVPWILEILTRQRKSHSMQSLKEKWDHVSEGRALKIDTAFHADRPDKPINADNSRTKVKYESRMYKGAKTEWIEHRYFAQIVQRAHEDYYNDTFLIKCGGAFITQQMILTASSCFNHWDGDLSQIRVTWALNEARPSDAESEGFNSGVSGIFRHERPQYKYMGKNIALVRLTRPRSTPDWPVLLLPQPDEDVKYIDTDLQSNIVAIGASLIGDNEGKILKKATLRLEKKNCSDLFYDEPDQLCATSKKFKLCHGGDLGSPVFANTSRGLIHIAHFTAQSYFCHQRRREMQERMAFSRTSYFTKWILMKIDKYTRGHRLDHLIEEWQEKKPDIHPSTDTRYDVFGVDHIEK